jgi:hypothetical protein
MQDGMSRQALCPTAQKEEYAGWLDGTKGQMNNREALANLS